MKRTIHLKQVWTANEFMKRFEDHLPQGNLNLFDKKIKSIVEHWKICGRCKSGFDFSELEGDFEDVLSHLIYYPEDYFVCKTPRKNYFRD